MSPANAAEAVGYYCGRIGPGLLGEPLNSLSNIAFLIGAAVAWRVWRSDTNRDPWLPALFVLLAFVGLGSFIFHSYPTRATLMGDLVPIQVFALTALAYACIRYLGLRPVVVLGLCGAFFLLRQGWIATMPRGALGGSITHIPALVVIGAVGVLLLRNGIELWRYAFLSCGAYAVAIVVRTFDWEVCRVFPLGLHWLWHLLTALTASLLVVGMAKVSPVRSSSRDGVDMSAHAHAATTHD